MKTIIAESRNITDYNLIKTTLQNISLNITEVVSGKAIGVDQLGEKYAEEFGLPIHPLPADWKKYGKSAGYKRNEEMANNAEALVAFWDGKSSGTKHMIDIAKRKKLKVTIVIVKEIKDIK